MGRNELRPVSDYLEAVVFEEREGIYWLSQRDLSLIEATVGMRYGAVRVGFDRDGALAQALRLMKRGLKVGLKRGETIRLLRLGFHPSAKPVAYSTIFLAPELLLDRRELGTLQAALQKQNCPIRPAYERGRMSLVEADNPAIFIYQVTAGMYEVDWQLTEASETSFRGLALAAHVLGYKLTCRLVAPRRASLRQIDAPGSEPNVYGQLRLDL